jgi:putative hydrolase of the HAD superfamily
MEMNYLDYIRKFLSEVPVMMPTPTLMKPDFKRYTSIKAIIFDVYGTILISTSGDIDESEISAENLRVALKSADIRITSSNPKGMLIEMLDSFKKEIKKVHQKERSSDKPYPEVDILEIWKSIIEEQHLKSNLVISNPLCIKCFTFIFEVIANNIYPMPGMKEVIFSLSQKGLPLGIISNAQFYTPVILNFFISDKVTEQEEVLPFDVDLTIFSYKKMRAKPDRHLFEPVKAHCEQKYGISPFEILFVGNDMFRDVYPAHLAGFRTALFAGDRKSLRLREEKA